MKTQHGFSLIEMMVALVVMSVIVAIAAPSAVMLRIAGQRQNAIDSLKSAAYVAVRNCTPPSNITTQGYNFIFSVGTCTFQCYDQKNASGNPRSYAACGSAQLGYIASPGTGCSQYFNPAATGDWDCANGPNAFTLTASPVNSTNSGGTIPNTRSYYVDGTVPPAVKFSDCCNTWQPVP